MEQPQPTYQEFFDELTENGLSRLVWLAMEIEIREQKHKAPEKAEND